MAQPPGKEAVPFQLTMPHYQYLIERQISSLSSLTGIRCSRVEGSQARFFLDVSFCYETLRWQVEYQRLRDCWVPDFVFPEESFQPLLSSFPGSASIADKLRKWDPADERQLYSLIRRIMVSYTAYQKACLERAAERDTRLQFELDTTAGEGGPKQLELLMVQGQQGGPNKAIFVVGVENLDFSCLRPFLARTWGEKGELPQASLRKLENMIFLKVVFPLSSAATPATSLHMAMQFEAVIGKPRLPQWVSGTCLMDYLPEVTQAIQEHCESAAVSAVLRQELLDAFIDTKLGLPLEVDAVACRSSVFQISRNGTTYILYLDIPQGFPEDQPCLTLQREGEESSDVTYENYGWSPRWSAKEMAKRISIFLSEQITKAHK